MDSAFHRPLNIGVLALQGAFIEHIKMLKSLSDAQNPLNIMEIRTASDIEVCDALVLPGGESTAMRIIADSKGSEDNVFQKLKAFVSNGKPVFGTCAGCILLSDRVSSVLGGGDNHKKSDVITLDSAALYGEQHVGGMDITTCRNFFGRQTKSFASKCNSKDAAFDGFTCVFIRAPAIASVGQMATKLATVKHGESETIVAARQGNLLGTCFHPELTNDDRIHRYFIGMVQEYFQKHSK